MSNDLLRKAISVMVQSINNVNAINRGEKAKPIKIYDNNDSYTTFKTQEPATFKAHKDTKPNEKKEKNCIIYKDNIEGEVKEELRKVFDDEFAEKATLEILENEDGKIKVLCYTKNKEIMLEKDGKDWKVYQI